MEVVSIGPVIKWLLPAVFLIASAVFYATPGYSFSGLMCLGIAAVIVCYFLLAMLKIHHAVAAKIFGTVLTAILCVGILMVSVTEVLILRASRGSEDTQCDYVVVLGAGLRGSEPSKILRSRIDRAITYLNENPNVRCIVSGGQGEDEAISEAQCMYDHLVAAGIDPSRIWMEDRSTSTWENFQFSLNLIEEKTGSRPAKIAVISSDFHLYRAGMFAKACGVEAVGIPARTPYLSLRINYYLREAAGVWHYLILGG